MAAELPGLESELVLAVQLIAEFAAGQLAVAAEAVGLSAAVPSAVQPKPGKRKRNTFSKFFKTAHKTNLPYSVRS